MFKKLSSSLLIVSACVFSSCTPTVKQEIAILPTPVSLTEQSGSFVLKDGMKIGVSDQSLFPAVGYLQEILRNVISSSVEVIWGIERSGFFNGQGKWAKGFENQMV